MKLNDSNVTIMVKSMSKAIKFYESLGLTILKRWGYHYAMLKGPGITIGLHPGGKGKYKAPHISIGFMVKKIDDAKKLLEKNEIKYKFQKDSNSGLYVHFKDLEGTTLYFVEPKW